MYSMQRCPNTYYYLIQCSLLVFPLALLRSVLRSLALHIIMIPDKDVCIAHSIISLFPCFDRCAMEGRAMEALSNC